MVLLYFVAVNSFYALLLASAGIEICEHLLKVENEARWRILGSGVAPRISVIAPAYNEAATIAESVKALLGLHYPNLEVVVISDGSRDATISVLQQQFELVPIYPICRRRLQTKALRQLYRSHFFPQLIVAEKENGGKADALNAGLNLATGELVCAIDADTLIERDALQRIVRPFLQSDDVVAAGGTIRVANGCTVEEGHIATPRVPRRALAGIQVVEYLRAFLFGRLGWDRLGGNLIISGAFGLFRREAVIAAGGYRQNTVGEDMELVMRLRKLGYERKVPSRVEFVPDPVAWTEVPESLRLLGRQRERWQRGLAEVLWQNRRVFLNPSYGALGMFIYPYYLVVELLAPAIEAIGLLGIAVAFALNSVNLSFAILFVLLAYGCGLIFSLLALLLEEVSYRRYTGTRERLLLLAWAMLEHFGYRQATVLWRLRGMLKFCLGHSDWGPMERRGFAPHCEPADAPLP